MTEFIKEYQKVIYATVVIINIVLMIYFFYCNLKNKSKDNSNPDANFGNSSYGNTGLKEDNYNNSNSVTDFSTGDVGGS